MPVPSIPGIPIAGAAELGLRARRSIPIERGSPREDAAAGDPGRTMALRRADLLESDGSETMLPGLDLPYPIPQSVLLLAARGELTLRAGINLLDAVPGDEREDREDKSK